jgi:uracil DNA glycosylase
MLFVGVVSPLVDMFRHGEMLETLFFRYIGSIICTLAVFAAFLIMILALHKIAKMGNPFSDKNIKTFKLSGNVMTYGGFFGCKHFSKCNEILRSTGQTPIDWQI